MYSSHDGDQKKMFNVLFKKSQFFVGIANYPSFLKQRLLNNKMPGSSTVAEGPSAGSIRRKHQAKQVPLVSLHLYNNAATIYFFPITHSIHPIQPINIPSDYCYSFCLAVYLAIYLFSFKLVSFLLGALNLLPNFI